MMGPPQTIVERAVTLCRNGEARSWPSLTHRLAREGFDPAHPSLFQHRDRVLDAMVRAAREGEIYTPGYAPGGPPLSRAEARTPSLEGSHGV